jgi:hypothetical protein
VQVGRRAGALAATAVLAATLLPAVAAADRLIAVAPLSTLGAEDTSAATRKLTADIEAALAATPDTKVIGSAAVLDAIKKSKRSQLKACEGDPACFAELGKLVGAQIVVTGEVGGLGDAKVVYLGAVDVATAKELRSTTLAVGAKDDGGGPRGAAIRLLDPDRYVGTVELAIDVKGATAYVNGRKVGVSPLPALTLPVGTHAFRITHPEFRDFVRFVDVEYGKPSKVEVGLQQYAIVQRDLTQDPRRIDRTVWVDGPWYRSWYVLAGGAVVLGVVAGVVAGVAAHQPPKADTCRLIGATGVCAL